MTPLQLLFDVLGLLAIGVVLVFGMWAAPIADAAVMARSGTVAVLLPGAFYAIRETQKPPVAAFRAQGFVRERHLVKDVWSTLVLRYAG